VGRQKQGTVRIIAGHWRGRRLPVPDLPGLRPSGDRSRETLFNWLAPLIRGRRCADLFAGTGVLGLEAVSRGAESAVLVEKSAAAARSIRENLEMLKTAQEGRRVEVVHGDALTWLESCDHQSLDLVFIDPPFDSGLETRVLAVLAEGECLAEDAIVYLETARDPGGSAPGQHWETMKEKVVGDVQMRLLKKKQNNL
jgi:16S rRNA (guanine966-N2)-methyltransferase